MARPYFRSAAMLILSGWAAASFSSSLQAQPYGDDRPSRERYDEQRHADRHNTARPARDRQAWTGRHQEPGQHARQEHPQGPGRHDGLPRQGERHQEDRRHAPGAQRFQAHGQPHGPAWRGGPPAYAGHSPGPSPHFRLGGLLPAPYADPGYYVVYPRYHGLPPPSHGQRWVRVGADYLLVAIATGLIIDMVLHPH